MPVSLNPAVSFIQSIVTNKGEIDEAKSNKKYPKRHIKEMSKAIGMNLTGLANWIYDLITHLDDKNTKVNALKLFPESSRASLVPEDFRKLQESRIDEDRIKIEIRTFLANVFEIPTKVELSRSFSALLVKRLTRSALIQPLSEAIKQSEAEDLGYLPLEKLGVNAIDHLFAQLGSKTLKKLQVKNLLSSILNFPSIKFKKEYYEILKDHVSGKSQDSKRERVYRVMASFDKLPFDNEIVEKVADDFVKLSSKPDQRSFQYTCLTILNKLTMDFPEQFSCASQTKSLVDSLKKMLTNHKQDRYVQLLTLKILSNLETFSTDFLDLVFDNVQDDELRDFIPEILMKMVKGNQNEKLLEDCFDHILERFTEIDSDDPDERWADLIRFATLVTYFKADEAKAQKIISQIDRFKDVSEQSDKLEILYAILANWINHNPGLVLPGKIKAGALTVYELNEHNFQVELNKNNINMDRIIPNEILLRKSAMILDLIDHSDLFLDALNAFSSRFESHQSVGFSLLFKFAQQKLNQLVQAFANTTDSDTINDFLDIFEVGCLSENLFLKYNLDFLYDTEVDFSELRHTRFFAKFRTPPLNYDADQKLQVAKALCDKIQDERLDPNTLNSITTCLVMLSHTDEKLANKIYNYCIAQGYPNLANYLLDHIASNNPKIGLNPSHN